MVGEPTPQGYVSVVSVVSLVSFLRCPTLMSVKDIFQRVLDKGFDSYFTMSDGVEVNFLLSDKALAMETAFQACGQAPEGQWTVACGPDTLWAYSYMFQHEHDAVLARLVLEG
jgi:hypothetical protein